MKSLSVQNLIKHFFFGNYFYGFCVVALSVESSLQQGLPLNNTLFYLLQFLITVVFYNQAFSRLDQASAEDNERAAWHLRHLKLFTFINWLFLILALASSFILIWPLRTFLSDLSVKEILLTFLFPLCAFSYYGINKRNPRGLNLRNIGWLKPFIIAFTWAGAVGILPQLFYSWSHHAPYLAKTSNGLLFLNNFMFLSALCIMFDIKDYSRDSNLELKTFAVSFGLRKTLYVILMPLLLLSLTSFLSYACLQELPFRNILLNCVPFLLCLAVAFELKRRNPYFFICW